MRLLVTTNARLYKGPDSLYYTSLVYGYDFFKRYLSVFEEVLLVAHVEKKEDVGGLLLVSGPHLSVYEVPFPRGKWNYFKAFGSIQRKVKHCADHCDAALFRVPDMLAFQIIPTIRKRHIPMAIEVTSDPLELYASKSGRYLVRPFMKWSHYFALRRCCRKADGVSYVTSHYLQKVYPSGITPNSNRFESHYTSAGIKDHENVERVFPKEGTINLIHVATSIAGKAKGHKELIEAFVGLRKKGRDVQLTIVGGGKLDTDIMELLEKSGEKSRVKFTGLVQKDELSRLFKESDIFVFPSYREGLPRVVVEAMSWGLPCVTSDIPGCRELLNERCLAPVKDSTKLMEILDGMMQDQSLLQKESERNRNESEQYKSDVIDEVRTAFYTRLYEMSKKHS